MKTTISKIPNPSGNFKGTTFRNMKAAAKKNNSLSIVRSVEIKINKTVQIYCVEEIKKVYVKKFFELINALISNKYLFLNFFLKKNFLFFLIKYNIERVKIVRIMYDILFKISLYSNNLVSKKNIKLTYKDI